MRTLEHLSQFATVKFSLWDCHCQYCFYKQHSLSSFRRSLKTHPLGLRDFTYLLICVDNCIPPMELMSQLQKEWHHRSWLRVKHKWRSLLTSVIYDVIIISLKYISILIVLHLLFCNYFLNNFCIYSDWLRWLDSWLTPLLPVLLLTAAVKYGHWQRRNGI